MTLALDDSRLDGALAALEQRKARVPERWHPLRPHPMQSRLYHTTERDVKVCAGRGSGKTELARRRIVRALRVKRPWPDPRYFYALPTYNQCRRVAREQILSLIPRAYFAKVPGDSAMEFKTVFGSWLFLVGLDMPARVEGDQYDGGVVDESSDQKVGVYARTLRPAMTHREGWLWRIGVPKRYGYGATEFRKAFERGTLGVDSFWWPSWDILPPEEIAQLREELDEKDYNEQIGGRWEDAGGACYYNFSASVTDGNVSDRAEYAPELMIYVGTDFNVDPMAWVLAHRVGDELQVFDEMWLRNTNTQQTLDRLWDRYGREHRAGWTFTGDASSQNRHTAASRTDYAQIQGDRRFKATVRYDRSNPGVRDRVSSVNAMLRAKSGKRRLLVHPRCQHLIEDLRSRALDELGNPAPAESYELAKADSGHATDALGYLVWKYYPIVAYGEGQKLVIVG